MKKVVKRTLQIAVGLVAGAGVVAIDMRAGDWVQITPEALVAIGDYTPGRNTWRWMRSWQIRSVEDMEDRIVEGICSLEPHNRGNHYSFTTELSQLPPIPAHIQREFEERHVVNYPWFSYHEMYRNWYNHQTFINQAKACGYKDSVVLIITPEGVIDYGFDTSGDEYR